MEEKKLTPIEILERGLAMYRKALAQPIAVTREEMCDSMNFEVMINAIISNMKATEGKTPEELMELAKKALNQD